MSHYSVNGYIAALRTRTTSKTLFVEGTDDKKAIACLLSRLVMAGKITARNIIIDSAELIKEKPHPGNRQIVEKVHAGIQGGINASEFFAVVDREFRDFEFGPPTIDQSNGHNGAAANLMWTRGHSMENYSFESTLISTFLLRMVPEHVNSDQIRDAAGSVRSLLQWCAAFSIACARRQTIVKASGCLTADVWEINGVGEIALSHRHLSDVFLARNVDSVVVQSLLGDVEMYHSAFTQNPNADSLVKWISHGHLGTEGLWSGVGWFLQQRGVAPSIVEIVSSGHKEVKLRIAAEIWADSIVNGALALPAQFMAWIGAPSP